jgi:hypothetical protein
MLSGAAFPTSSLRLVAQELSTRGVYVLLQALAVAISPSGFAILWKAVEVMQIGESILYPKIEVLVPFHCRSSTKQLVFNFISLKTSYYS